MIMCITCNKRNIENDLLFQGETTEGPSIEELVNNESVDNLTYMGWINSDNMDEKVQIDRKTPVPFQ